MSGPATGPEELEPHYRGVVMPWECDDMGHLNVRFHVSRYAQAQRHLASSGVDVPEWPTKAIDRFVFLKEARVGARLACSLRAHADISTGGAFGMSGCLWDMSSGDVLTRAETVFSSTLDDPAACGASPDIGWAKQDVEHEWSSAVGMLLPCADSIFGMSERVTAAVSDANALAVLELSSGSDYRMDESPIGFVVAAMTIVRGENRPAGAAFSANTALLARSRRSITLRHRFATPGGEGDIATVQSVCVFFDRESRRTVPIPFDI